MRPPPDLSRQGSLSRPKKRLESPAPWRATQVAPRAAEKLLLLVALLAIGLIAGVAVLASVWIDEQVRTSRGGTAQRCVVLAVGLLCFSTCSAAWLMQVRCIASGVAGASTRCGHTGCSRDASTSWVTAAHGGHYLPLSTGS